MKRALRLFKMSPDAPVEGTALPTDVPSDVEVARQINRVVEPLVRPANERVRWIFPMEGCPPMRLEAGSEFVSSPFSFLLLWHTYWCSVVANHLPFFPAGFVRRVEGQWGAAAEGPSTEGGQLGGQ